MKYLIIVFFLSGCAAYKRTQGTPDTFDLHVTVDEHGRPNGGFGGFGWNLKK